MVGIYKITNKLNNKCYIGQSIDIKTRWIQHIYEGKHNTRKGKLYPAMFQNGIENFIFEVIEECPPDQKILNERERYWIKFYNSFENGYNSTIGGQGEDSWTYDPSLIRQLWDEGYSTGEIIQIVGCGHTTVQNRLKGYKDYNCKTSHQRGWAWAAREGRMGIQIGQLYSLDKDNYLISYFGPVVPIHQYSLLGEYIQSFPSIEAAGRFLNIKYPCAIGKTSANPEERATAYGYQWRREKVDSLPPVSVPHGKVVKCINTQEIFSSTVLAAKAYNIKSHTNINECCAGKRHSAGKHPETGEKLHWEYVE